MRLLCIPQKLVRRVGEASKWAIAGRGGECNDPRPHKEALVKGALCVLLMCLSPFAVACGSDGAESAGETSAAATVPATSTEVPSVVGRWERVNECPQLVKAFDEAGLAEVAPSFAGDYFPDATPKELARKADVCTGAQPFVHSHFFTDEGGFGSLTEDLEQVDDGSYEITDDGTFVISKEFPGVTFHYAVDGETLTMTPVLTDAMKEEALAHPLDFTPAGWAITMSYPTETWKRVDCEGWC